MIIWIAGLEKEKKKGERKERFGNRGRQPDLNFVEKRTKKSFGNDKGAVGPVKTPEGFVVSS